MASRAGQMNAARTAKLAPSDACDLLRAWSPTATGPLRPRASLAASMR